MALTPEQLIERQKYICGSDVAAILGLDPDKSAADVWLEKTGRVEQFKGNEATRRGVDLEPAILNMMRRRLGFEGDRDIMLVHPNGMLAANFDEIVLDPQRACVFEAKSTVKNEDWGEDGTEDVPDRVIAQCHMQLLVAQAATGIQFTRAYVGVIMPGYRSFDDRLYPIDRNDELCQAIEEQAVAFMRNYVRADVPPDDFRPSLEVAKRLKRVEGEAIELPDIAVSLWRQAKEREKEARQQVETAEADLLSAMGAAEIARCGLGTVTYKETQRKGYTVEPTSYRQLRFKANKEK